MIKENDLIDERYKIISLIGHGGMSDVFEARDIIMKRPVAIKILNEESMNNSDARIRFEYEARVSASLNHKNIVKIYNYSEYKGTPFIANEFQKGQTLKDVLEFKLYFPFPEACQIMIQILSALEYMHSKGVIHRDIKPQNIFYGANGIAKVSDFGISIIKGAKTPVDEKGKAVGTVQYLAPEVIRGEKANEQSDIYSAGVTFYELLTGYIPFDDTNPRIVAENHLKKDIPSPNDTMLTLPSECDEIIQKATNRILSLRYKTASEMKKDIEDLYQNKRKIKEHTSFFDRFFRIKKLK